MRYWRGLMCVLVLVALPLSVSAQDEGVESTVEEPAFEQPTPSTEAGPEEPAAPSEPTPEDPWLELELDDDSVKLAPATVEEMEMDRRAKRARLGYKELENRVGRAKIGLGVSVSLTVLGAMLAGVGALGELCIAPPPDEPCAESFPGLIATGTVMGVGGLAGTIASGVLLRQHKRALRELRGIPPTTRRGYASDTREAVDVDTSDDAFTVIVTRKYDGDEFTGATVFIRHKESGRHAKPYIDAAEIDTLDQVIREHKARLLSGE